ncbi:hypothetical protein [Sphingomonas sp.]|uniref:hypothetical protein n=1 Tax=Sphingomonas sp. TaxID=28214 RepID=UPI0025FACF40|nr:hypothetical protein [Sphingomonas sp.]
MNVTEALRTWINYREQMARLYLVAGSTVRNQRAITIVLSNGLGDHQLEKLRKSHIELWMGQRLQTCAPVTVRGELNVLRQVLNWCVDEGHLLAKPRFPTLSVANVEADLPSDDAFLWVLAHVPEQHARALEFMMLTGLSPHELERVQVQDGGWSRSPTTPGQNHLLGIGQRDDFPVKQASRKRWVPLNDRARAIWYQATAGYQRTSTVFPSVAAMQKAIRRAFASDTYVPALPGADQVTPKLMRKWFASKVASQQPEHVLQRLMGHAPGSPITRRHYVRSNEGQGRDAVADLAV